MNKENILKELSRSQDFNLNSLLTFFKNTNEKIKDFSESAKYTDTLKGQLFIIGWIDKMNDVITQFLTENLQSLSDGLSNKDNINKAVDMEDFENRVEEMNMMNPIDGTRKKKNLMEDFLQERGLIFEPRFIKIPTHDMPIQCSLIKAEERLSVKKIEEIKDVMNLGEDIQINDIDCPDGHIQGAQASKNILYFISHSDKKKLFKHNIQSGQTTEYPFEDFTNCLNISYNQSMNRVIVSIKSKGIYWFVPGQENQMKKYSCLPVPIKSYSKTGMIFLGVKGISMNFFDAFYCPNLLEEKSSVKLNIMHSWISSIIFLDNNHAAILYQN